MKQLFFTIVTFLTICFPSATQAQTLQWANGFGGDSWTNSFNFLQRFELASNGDLVCAGSVRGNGNYDPAGNATHAFATGANTAGFLLRYDANGNIIWSRTLQGATINIYSTPICHDVVLDASDNIYVAGRFNGTVVFDPLGTPAPSNTLHTPLWMNFFLAKYDANGNFLWAKHLEGSNYAAQIEIEIDLSGNLLVASSYQDDIDMDPSAGVNMLSSTGGYNIFLAKYDQNGNLLDAKNIGGTGDENLSSFKFLGNQIYITGNFNGATQLNPATSAISHTSHGETDGFVAAYSTAGNFIRSFSIGGTGNDGINAIALKFNRLYLGGYFTGTADLNPQASSTTNRTAIPNTIGGIEGQDGFLLRCNPLTGTLAWVQPVGGAAVQDGVDWDLVADIQIDAVGDIYFTGQYNGLADFDASAGISTLNSNNNLDCFVARWKEGITPVFKWAVTGNGGTYRSNGNALRLGPTGTLFVAGIFERQMDFDPANSPLGDLVTSSGYGRDCFLARFDNVNQLVPPGPPNVKANFDTSVEPRSQGTNEYTVELQLGPNPFTNSFFVRLQNPAPQTGTIRLFNTSGQLLHSQTILAGQTAVWVQAGGLPPGALIVSVDLGSTRSRTVTLIKQ